MWPACFLPGKMREGSVLQSRRAYVNCDDRHLDAFMKYVTLSDGSDGRTKQVFYYGEGEKADYRIGNLKKSQNGVLEAPGIEFTMSGALDADIRSVPPLAVRCLPFSRMNPSLPPSSP